MANKVKKLWVTGASGFLGGHLCQVAHQQGWQVFGTYGRHAIAFPDIAIAPLDLQDPQALQTYFDTIRPDAVIHTAAQSKVNLCQQHPAQTYAINVSVSRRLAELCATAAIPYLFTSTDLVFDGQHAPYRETDSPSPVNHYGSQKAQAEVEILACYPQAVVCRLPLLFGAATATAGCFLQSFLHTLRAGEPLKLFVDEFRTPVSVMTAAHSLLWVLDQPIQGLLHLGGQQRISRYEMGQLMVDVLQIPKATLQPCRQQDLASMAPRPADVSLDSTIAFNLGYVPPSLEAEFTALRGLI